MIPLSLKYLSSPYFLVVPILGILISWVCLSHFTAEKESLITRWEMGIKKDIDSLTNIIGARSGENSAKAAKGDLFFRPVFQEEIDEIKRLNDRLLQGPGRSFMGQGDGPAKEVVDDLVSRENYAIDCMIASFILSGIVTILVVKKQLRQILPMQSVKMTNDEIASTAPASPIGAVAKGWTRQNATEVKPTDHPVDPPQAQEMANKSQN